MSNEIMAFLSLILICSVLFIAYDLSKGNENKKVKLVKNENKKVIPVNSKSNKAIDENEVTNKAISIKNKNRK